MADGVALLVDEVLLSTLKKNKGVQAQIENSQRKKKDNQLITLSFKI